MKYESEFIRYLENERQSGYVTVNAYAADIKAFAEYLENTRGKDELSCTQADAVAYLLELKEEGKSSSTVNRKLSAIRAYYAFLSERGIIRENPALHLKSPKVQRSEVEYLSVEEIEKLLDIEGEDPKTLRDKALLEIMYATGLRATELCLANAVDINLIIGYISVDNLGSRPRLVPVGRKARDAVKEYFEKGRPALVEGTEDLGALFVNVQGQRISRQGIWKILKEYGEKAGLEDRISPQILRNSFAVHMAQNGADPRSLKELMGFDDINAVNIYLSATKNRIMDVYDKTHPRA